MKDIMRKLLGNGRMALVVCLLAIGVIAGISAIQPHLVAKASVSVISNQQQYHDQSTGTIHGSSMGSMDQGMLSHPESNPSQSASGNHRMSMPSGNTMPGMDMPGMDSGHSEHNPPMGISLDAKTIVLGSFATFNGLILIIAALLKRHLPQRKRIMARRRKTNQSSHAKESII